VQKKDVLKIAGLTFLIAFSLFATVSLVTYDPRDVDEEYPHNPEVRNFCGWGGALAAQWLQRAFGRFAVTIPVLCALLAYEIIRWGRVKKPYAHVIGGALFVVSGVSLASLWSEQGHAGGILGVLLSNYVLTRFLPAAAANLTALFFLFVSLLLLTDMRLLHWLKAAFAGAYGLLHSRVKQIETSVEPAAGSEPIVRMSPPPQEASSVPEMPFRVDAAAQETDEPSGLPADVAEAPEPDEEDEVEPETESEEEPEHATYIPEPEMEEEPEEAEAPPSPPPKPRQEAKPKPEPKPKPRPKPQPYDLPGSEMLEQSIHIDLSQHEHHIKEKAAILENTLKEFNIEARVVEIQRGPVITQYELSLAPGIKVQRIISLSDDIAMAVKAPSVRIVAPIPGKSTVGIEVPNSQRQTVRLREIIDGYKAVNRSAIIPLMLGRDAAGVPLYSDLAQMPHLLIAGATGSGKSVCINSVILSIVMLKTPEEVKVLLIDPKMVELACFKDVPHLMSPVVTDMKRAASILEWACLKMDDRYALFSRAGVRNIAAFNQLGEEEIRRRLTQGDTDAEIDDVPFSLPHIVIIVDELADLMMIASKEVESSITRLSQKSRAVGIHLILATQRPSVDVITGLIKANLPSRVSFKVSSKIDSGVILDQRGAEKLLGMGDMLFLPPGTSRLVRAQGTFVSDAEINAITDFARAQREPDYDRELAQFRMASQKSPEERDELYPEAVQIVLETQRGSVSLLQRRLEIGYSRAARLIDMMADDGIVGEYKGSQARDILISLDEWEALQGADASEDG